MNTLDNDTAVQQYRQRRKLAREIFEATAGKWSEAENAGTSRWPYLTVEVAGGRVEVYSEKSAAVIIGRAGYDFHPTDEMVAAINAL